MGNCENLDTLANLAIDDGEWKPLQPNFSDLGPANDLEAFRRSAGQCNSSLERRVVTRTKADLPLLVVSDLLLVLQRCFWMEHMAHLSSACTRFSSSSAVTRRTVP